MKLQNKDLNNPTIHGLNNIFRKVGRNSFYVNSSCVLATEKIISIGKEYVVFDNTTDTGIKISDVILGGCYNRDGIIYLIVQDIRSHRVLPLTIA
jgi:hypothetical protein